MIIALAILAFITLCGVYMVTDLTELIREQLTDEATDTLGERSVEAVAGTGQVPYGAANRDEATAYAWKRRGASGRVQLKNEASPHAYSTLRSPNVSASLPAPHRAGERGDRPDSLLRGLTASAGATVFDWDADGMGDAA